MERKYYEAYDDRYRKIHGEGLQWFYNDPSPIVSEMIQRYGIAKESKILELGCGEGRDAYPLLHQGYNLMATDISEAAIHYAQNKWPQYTEKFRVLDCIEGEDPEKYDFIYAVAVLHMLVEDADRDAFYAFIRNHLTTNGIALICTMGDGLMERQADIRTAFELQNRIHEPTGKIVQIANTSCRMVNFDTFREELHRNHLTVLQEDITAAPPDFPVMMYAVVSNTQREPV